jgi:hypothetical protein
MDIINRYFYLSDYAGKDKEKLAELLSLFSKNAVIEPNGGRPMEGDKEYIPFFEEFFGRNDEMKHIWNIIQSQNELMQVNWGVVCRRKSGDLFTLTGSDYFKIENNQITYLKIIGNNH